MTKEQIDIQFQEFRDELNSFLFRLITDRELSKDIVHDTYLKTVAKIDTFKGNSSFKTWVFSIATNLAKNSLTKQNRWVVEAQDYGAMLHVKSKEHWNAFQEVFDSTPEQKYSVKEHLVYCFNCMNKTLEIEQQICLWLKEVYDFKIKEIMTITELSEGKVKHAIANARKTLVKTFERRCAIVSQNGACNQCSELTGILNPRQKAQEKVNQLKLAKKKNSESLEKLLDIRLEMVKSIDPLNSNNTLVTAYFLENSEKWVEEGKMKNILENSSESTL